MDSLTHGKTLSKKESSHEPISGRQVSELVEEALYTLYTAEDARALDNISDIFDAINRTKPGTLLKSQIPIRTWADWNEDRTHKGNRPLCAALNQAANAASRAPATCLSAQYHRLAGRRGKKKAIVAVEHSIVVIAY